MNYGDWFREKTVYGERAQVCEQVLSQQLGLVEGVRKIVERTQFLGFATDNIEQALEQIDLQSKHFPLGECRDDYSDSELQSLDKERQRFESDHRDAVVEYCQQLLERCRPEDER